MKNLSIINILAFSTAAVLPAAAQYNPTIDVDGKYKPDVIIQERVNTFPERMRFGTLSSQLQFDTEGVVTDFTPLAVPMPATGWQDSRGRYPYRGYVRAELGSWLDASLDAGYRFVMKPNTLAGAYLRYNSTTLWKPDVNEYETDQKRALYDGTLGFYVRHHAPGAGTLDADVRYNAAYYNYYGFQAPVPDAGSKYGDMRTKAPSQTSNDFKFSADWNSALDSPFQYNIGAGVRYLAMRRGYTRDALRDFMGTRETDVSIRLGLGYRTNEKSAFALGLEADLLFYGGQYYETPDLAISAPDSYQRFVITPAYRYGNNAFNLSVGPRIDLIVNTYDYLAHFPGINVASPRDKGQVFRIAPDFNMNWHTRGFAVSLGVTGGTQLSSMAWMRDATPYCQPFILSTMPVYSPLDASLRLGFGPFAGFRGELTAAYRFVTGQRTGGWYQTYMNGGYLGTSDYLLFGNAEGYDSHGLSVGLTLAYDYGRYLNLKLSGTYQRQNGENSYFNGYDLPEATLSASVGTNPWRSLRFSLDYDLRACRRIAYMAVRDESDLVPKVYNACMGNWSDLSFKASYDILKNLRVSLLLDNLLNRRQEVLPALPVPGLTIHGALSFEF